MNAQSSFEHQDQGQGQAYSTEQDPTPPKQQEQQMVLAPIEQTSVFTMLPSELILEIFSYLDIVTIFRFLDTCRYHRYLLLNLPEIWKRIRFIPLSEYTSIATSSSSTASSSLSLLRPSTTLSKAAEESAGAAASTTAGPSSSSSPPPPPPSAFTKTYTRPSQRLTRPQVRSDSSSDSDSGSDEAQSSTTASETTKPAHRLKHAENDRDKDRGGSRTLISEVYAVLRRFRKENRLIDFVREIYMDSTDTHHFPEPLVMLIKFPCLEVISSRYRRKHTSLVTDTRTIKDWLRTGVILPQSLRLRRWDIFHPYMVKEDVTGFKSILDTITIAGRDAADPSAGSSSEGVVLDIRICPGPEDASQHNTVPQPQAGTHAGGGLHWAPVVAQPSASAPAPAPATAPSANDQDPPACSNIATCNAFSVKVLSSATVDDLKKLIKAEKPNTFKGIDAGQLTLWRVNHPVIAANEHQPVFLNAIDSPMQLDPTDDIADVFAEPPPKKNIHVHVLVQRPPQVHAPVHIRTSIPRLKFISADHLEQELALILNGVLQHQTIPPIEPKDAEAYQKRRLGPFYKRTLPYHRNAEEINLAMTSTGETLMSIVDDEIGARSGNRVVAMMAPSGSGKTATVIDLATKHFVIYCVCSAPRATVSPDFNDVNFITLATDVENMYVAVVGEEQGNQFDIDLTVKSRAKARIELEFLARMLFLQLLLNRIPDLEPRQFFNEQTTPEGASTIGTLVYKLREYDTVTIEAMRRATETKLHSRLIERRRGLVIAVNEAQVAENDILAGKLISPSALIRYKDKDIILDGKNQVQLKYRCGLLTTLSATLSSMRATLVFSGTAFSLQNADPGYAALGKATNFTEITDFPQF
ncbi:hypothetical protein BGZ70_002615 [Mortierella alpina]|uniref:F-box domain-containing protein n=1 Tax=Mortierella alpina TaxID=64518 RepID=A0A9P6JBN4_MORAP|nr:hypothetical protein BGZ70_002615 [Mortierella alpina]